MAIGIGFHHGHYFGRLHALHNAAHIAEQRSQIDFGYRRMHRLRKHLVLLIYFDA
ncbi:MAG: hypothetical protein Q9P14_04360 [candidate division KSB1 bacterium]|nr:hypothetical protein [candidate division KSB1 bacterium]